MTTDLAGLRLWITRPEDSAPQSAARWQEHGAQVKIVSLIRLEPLAFAGADLQRLRDSIHRIHLLMTSPNAVRFWLQALADQPELARALLDRPVFAIGEATAELCRQAGHANVEIAPRATGEDLGRYYLSQQNPPGEALAVLPGSDLRPEDLPSALKKAGMDCLILDVFANRPAQKMDEASSSLLRGDGVDLVLLYSPSAVRSFVDVAIDLALSPTALPPVAVMGPRSLEAALILGLRIAAAPENPGEDELIEAVKQWWQVRRESRR